LISVPEFIVHYFTLYGALLLYVPEHAEWQCSLDQAYLGVVFSGSGRI